MPGIDSTPRFLERAGSVYRLLIEEMEGSWLISYSSPATPFFVAFDHLCQFSRIPAPGLCLQTERQTPAQKARLELIQPLLDVPACITDKAARMRLALVQSREHGTTVRRILQLYYRYLATGRTFAPRTARAAPRNELFESAIRSYYYSARKLSLRAAYDMMLVQHFTDASGKLTGAIPTWSQFRHYFYDHGFHKNPQKAIARNGLTDYQRNERPAFGCVSDWRPKPGSYQMDATQADIYLVSRFDRSIVVGRPYIYMAVDTATQLIAGIHVGFNCDATAVMACLVHAAGDKAAFCRTYGIDITTEQWPNSGMPLEIITDNGREFFGARMELLCRCYGIETQALLPFRPDRKGLVEKAFDLLQSRYKPLLRGKGVIEEDAQERWAVDYRTQAALDINEFTQVVLYAVIYLNNGRLLADGRTAAQHWIDLHPALLDVPAEELYPQTLPRQTVKLTRKGFRLNGMWYTPPGMEGLYLREQYTLAYDPADLSSVYIVFPDRHQRCGLSDAKAGGLSEEEWKLVCRERQSLLKKGRECEVKASVAAIQAIRTVVQGADTKKVPVERLDREDIRQNQLAERERLT